MVHTTRKNNLTLSNTVIPSSWAVTTTVPPMTSPPNFAFPSSVHLSTHLAMSRSTSNLTTTPPQPALFILRGTVLLKRPVPTNRYLSFTTVSFLAPIPLRHVPKASEAFWRLKLEGTFPFSRAFYLPYSFHSRMATCQSDSRSIQINKCSSSKQGTCRHSSAIPLVTALQAKKSCHDSEN